MSKTSEQKALEAYPDKYIHTPFGINIADINDFKRESYVKGYNQAMKDFLNKACEWLSKQPMSRPVFWTVEDFKNYMEEEL